MDTNRTLVIVEDDSAFATTLKRSFERRGYEVDVAAGLEELDAILKVRTPGYAVVDLKLAGASELACVEALHARGPSTVIVVLTGFASIAVEAIKLGARHYLVKPSSSDDIEDAFGKASGDSGVALTERPTSIKTVEWEHIHQTLVEANFNI
jgi:two-component system, response regulator RegA